MNYSVVISTYIHEKTEYLRESLLSIIQQTVVPNEIVIVFDGHVPAEQEKLVEDIISQYPVISFKQIKLDQNVGRGKARNIGVKSASYEYVAIMDSDDISKSTRFEEQLKILQDKSIDVVASWQEEFRSDSDVVLIKKCPEFNDEIRKTLKFRNLIPNPSMMFNKSLFLEVGGYGENKHMGEDHILCVRFAMHNAVFYCIQKPLIDVRINDKQRKRRGSFAALKDDLVLRLYLYRVGYTTFIEFIVTFFVFTAFRLSPTPLKDLVFSILRDRK